MTSEPSDAGYYRLWHIIGSPKKGIPPIIPVSASTWWDGVKSGRFPKPVKLSEKVTAWRKSEIEQLAQSFPKQFELFKGG